jgi:putative nucleotidyltransferase with HDIG domain
MSILNELLEAQEFATLPVVAARVLKLLENENIDIRDIAKVIEADAALTLKLLRVANSPLYATRTEVSSIQQAIITLGLNRLTNIVLGISIFSRFLLSSQKQAANIMEKFWWHSSCTGMVAKSLSSKLKISFKEIEFIGGLLHDIGKMAMIQYDANKYNLVVDLITRNNITDSEAETMIFGVSHTEVGEHIGKLWKLPEDLALIISMHTHPALLTSHQEIVAVVRFADVLCELWGASIYEGLTIPDLSEEESWKVLCEFKPEIKKYDMTIFTDDLEQDFEKSSTFLNLISKQ